MMVFEMLRAGTATAVVFIAGFGVQRLLADRREIGPVTEQIGLAWILGSGWISITIATLGIVLHGAALCIALFSGAVLLAGFACRRNEKSTAPKLRLSILEWILVGVLVMQAVLIGIFATRLALRWDALVTWEWKARLAFSNGGSLPATYFRNTEYGWSHIRYPLGLPYLESWLYLCLGRADQSWVRIIGPLYYLAGVATITGACKRLGSASLTGWCAGTAMFFVPYAFAGTWGMFSGYADLPLGIVLVAAISRIPSITTTDQARLMGVLAALLPWMKREGQYLWVIAVALATVQLIRARRTRDLLWVIAPGAIVILVFEIAMKLLHAPPHVDSFTVTFPELSSRADRIGIIADRLGEAILDFDSWSFLWPGAIMATIALLFRRQISLAGTFGGGLLFCWLLLGGAYLFGYPMQFENHIATTIDRVLLQFMPLAVLTIAVAVPNIAVEK